MPQTRLVFKALACAPLFLFLLGSIGLAASVTTDTTDYPPGGTVTVFGSGFWANETITVQVTHLDGDPTDGEGHDPWNVPASGSGSFTTYWTVPYDDNLGETLMVAATGQTSGLTASATFIDAIGTDLDQLQNGTTSTSPEWSNGNINTSNSCYSEANSVPFRFFITGTTAGTSHVYTIEMEWTKGGIHAYDYLTDYDLTEADPIDSAGGPCGTISTSPPGDCATPTGSFALPDFGNTANYTGPIPGDFFPGGFVFDSPRNLKFYNATVDSVGKYSFGGTSSDRTLIIKVYFKTTSTGSVGFFWGGHLASGAANAWTAGMGSASVSGAPYHMRAKNFDNQGGAGQDRSIQNGSICLAPDATITCASGSLACTNLSSSCSAASGADSYEWTVTGGMIDSGQGTNTVYYTATSSDSVIISLTACNTATGCSDDFCCASDTEVVYIEANNPPTIAFGNDTSIFQCSPAQICLPYVVSDPDGPAGLVEMLVSGPGTIDTLNNLVCFTPVASGIYTFVAKVTDPCGAEDRDTINVTVTLNSPPIASCPGNTSFTLCDPEQICVGPFTCDDPDSNVESSSVSLGTLSGDNVCFTPDTAGTYTIRLICTDSCDAADTCVTLVTVDYIDPPVVNDSSITVVLCAPATVCFDLPTNVGGAPPYSWTLNGSPVSDSICFVLNDDTVIVATLIVTDSCGHADTATWTITATVNTKPILTITPPSPEFVCNIGDTVCVDIDIDDPDNGLSGTSVLGVVNFSDSTVCFAVSGAGTFCDTVVVTDSCGLSDTATYCIEVEVNSPPPAVCPPDTTIFLCAPTQICVGPFTCNDPDGNLQSSTISFGTKVGDNVCFTPATSGVYTIRQICTDSCGAADTCETDVTVIINSPPVIAFGPDFSECQCTPTQICLPYALSDPDGLAGLVEMLVSGPGTIDTLNNRVCFTPAASGTYTFIAKVTDPCGAEDRDTISVTVVLNSPPTISFGNDTNIFLCTPTEICLPYMVADAGCPPGLLETLVSGPGTIDTANNEVCFTSGTGVYVFVVAVTDTCGAEDRDTIVVEITINSPPTVVLGPDQDVVACTAQEICVSYAVSDPDGPSGLVESLVSGPGTIDTLNNKVCFTPSGSGVDTIIVRVENSCGTFDQDTAIVTVALNSPPSVSCPPDQMRFLCDSGLICVGPFTCFDPDGNIAWDSASYGDLDGDIVCFDPDTVGTYVIRYICTDSCGAADTCETTVFVSEPELVIDTLSALSNSTVEVCLRVSGMSFPWGGFDFLVNFDATMLTFQGATPGNFIIDCDWEYFTYRLESMNPGLIRLVAIADMNNSNKHPSCLTPDSGDVIACLKFTTSNDRNVACQSTQIRFWWADCGDNTISDPTGEILYIVGDQPFTIVDYAGNDLTGLVNVGGPGLCPSDKYTPLPCVKFQSGKVRIVCPGEIDDRGDINLNALAYEIADAVLYSNYFIWGSGVLSPAYYEAQIAASDVNADGVPLTVADLVYLVRVITGDVAAVPDDFNGKVAAPAGLIDVAVAPAAGGYVVSTSSQFDLGASLFVFKYEGGKVTDVSAADRASNMKVDYRAQDGELRVLVYDIGREKVAAGEGAVLNITAPGAKVELVSVEAATFDGEALKTNLGEVVPSKFVLYQNYPNPFNPSTSFTVDFPVKSQYTLTVYNIAGQMVRTFAGEATPGKLRITWDGRSESDAQVASGVYFYKLVAGEFSAVRKMVLMK